MRSKILFASLMISLLMFNTSCSKFLNRMSLKYAPYDAIIVPGVPFNGTEWEDIMKMRVYWSYLLYNRGVTKHIIYSGADVYTSYYESKIMRLYAIKLGIPDSIIYTDTIAQHSTENVWYSYKLAKQNGFQRIALATDPFQNLMVSKFKRDHELYIRSMPIIFSEVDTFMRIPSPTIDPSSAYSPDFISIEERESKWKQFKGTLGLEIK